eukprot:1158784-Pelagomonas_calceolata.AAC.2
MPVIGSKQNTTELSLIESVSQGLARRVPCTPPLIVCCGLAHTACFLLRLVTHSTTPLSAAALLMLQIRRDAAEPHCYPLPSRQVLVADLVLVAVAAAAAAAVACLLPLPLHARLELVGAEPLSRGQLLVRGLSLLPGGCRMGWRREQHHQLQQADWQIKPGASAAPERTMGSCNGHDLGASPIKQSGREYKKRAQLLGRSANRSECMQLLEEAGRESRFKAESNSTSAECKEQAQPLERKGEVVMSMKLLRCRRDSW